MHGSQAQLLLGRNSLPSTAPSQPQLPPSHSFLPGTASFQALLPSRHCFLPGTALQLGVPLWPAYHRGVSRWVVLERNMPERNPT